MTERIAKWDNIRLVLIFCVVLGHAINYFGVDSDHNGLSRVYLFIYAFHMPAFVFLSGLFSKRAVREYRYDKAFMFLMLYFVVKFSLFLVRIVALKYIPFNIFGTVGVDWYAFAIFLFYLLTMFLQRFDKRYVIAAALVICCMAGYDRTLGGQLVLGRVMAFYPFFLAGFYLKQDDILRVVRQRWAKLLGVAILVIAALVAANCYDQLEFLLPLLKGSSFRKLGKDFRSYGALLRLGSYLVASLMTFALIAVIPSVKSALSRMGSRTMAVYAFHYCIITAAASAFDLKHVLRKEMLESTANVVVVLMTAAIVIVLSLRPFDRLIRWMTVPPLAKEKETV